MKFNNLKCFSQFTINDSTGVLKSAKKLSCLLNMNRLQSHQARISNFFKMNLYFYFFK